MEIWKKHPVYTEYEGSNNGNIRHYRKRNYAAVKATVGNDNYCRFNIYINGKRVKTSLVSRFIWECFNGVIDPGKEIDHISTDRTDNRLDNLRLCDNHSQNMKNPATIEKIKKKVISPETKNKIAESHKKEIVQYTMDGKYVREWKSIKEAQEYFNPKTQNIVFTLKGYGGRKSAYGFIWRYK